MALAHRVQLDVELLPSLILVYLKNVRIENSHVVVVASNDWNRNGDLRWVLIETCAPIKVGYVFTSLVITRQDLW